jgi:hypothetical protein
MILLVGIFMIWIKLPNSDFSFSGVEKNKEVLSIIMIVILIVLVFLLTANIIALTLRKSFIRELNKHWITYLLTLVFIVVSIFGAIKGNYDMLHAGVISTFLLEIGFLNLDNMSETTDIRSI